MRYYPIDNLMRAAVRSCPPPSFAAPTAHPFKFYFNRRRRGQSADNSAIHCRATPILTSMYFLTITATRCMFLQKHSAVFFTAAIFLTICFLNIVNKPNALIGAPTMIAACVLIIAEVNFLRRGRRAAT